MRFAIPAVLIIVLLCVYIVVISNADSERNATFDCVASSAIRHHVPFVYYTKDAVDESVVGVAWDTFAPACRKAGNPAEGV